MKNDNHLDPKFMQNQTNDNNCREKMRKTLKILLSTEEKGLKINNISTQLFLINYRLDLDEKSASSDF